MDIIWCMLLSIRKVGIMRKREGGSHGMEYCWWGWRDEIFGFGILWKVDQTTSFGIHTLINRCRWLLINKQTYFVRSVCQLGRRLICSYDLSAPMRALYQGLIIFKTLFSHTHTASPAIERNVHKLSFLSIYMPTTP